MAIILGIVDFQLYRMAAAARADALRQAEATLRTSTEVVLGRVDQMLDTQERAIAGIAEVISLRGRLSDKPDLYLHRLLVRSQRITTGLRWLFIIREDGTLAEYSAGFPAMTLDLADREYFRHQVDNWEQGLYVGAPLVARIDNLPFIPVSRRVENDGNRFLGVIAAGIDPGEITPLLADQALPAGFTLHLLLRDGRTLACLPAAAGCLQEDWSQAPLFRDLLPQAPRGVFHRQRLLAGEAAPAAYAASDKYPVVVAARVDEPSALAPWRQALGGYIALAVGSNAALAGIAFFAFRQSQRRRQAMAALAEANQHLEERVATRTEQLRQSEARARALMNTAMDAVIVIDDKSHIVEFSRAAERMFGYASDEVLGQGLNELMPFDIGPVQPSATLAAAESSVRRLMGRGREVIARHRDGEQFPVEVTVGSTGEGGQPLHVAIIRDISERKVMEQELLRLATTDDLTGLLNRRAFSEEAERLVTLARRYRRPLTLLILDADRFKAVNDTYGHPVGDAVLRALAATLDSRLRGTDLLGRLGGEEFGILLPETTAQGGCELGERLLAAIRACRVEAAGEALHFTVSIGLASLDSQGVASLESLLQQADDALYRAKESGRDRLECQARTLAC